MAEVIGGWARPQISQWVDDAATRWPEAVAVTTPAGDSALTFTDLARNAVRAAADLEFIAPGDRVGVVMRRLPRTVEWLFAVWSRHATVVPFAPSLGRRQLQHRLAAVDICAMLDPAADDPVRWREGCVGSETRHRLDPHVPLIMFTSGSTGDPKPVQITHRNLRSAAVANSDRVTGGPETVWFDPLPLEHMGGLMPVIRAPLYGMSTVIDADFDPSVLSARIERSGGTAISLVPTMLRRWLEAARTIPPQLEAVLVGGDAAPAALVRHALSRGMPLYVTYGMTETTSQIATATPEMLAADARTVGPPVGGLEVRALDADGSPSGVGQVGKLVVDGPMLTPGYLDGDRGAFTDYGLMTGDEGCIDAEGWLRIGGRLGRRIITGGETVDPRVTEQVLTDLSWVRSAWVTGVEDQIWGERVIAAVTPRSPPDLDEALVAIAADLDTAHRPREIHIIDGLARTPSGTVDTVAMRSRIRARDPEWHA
jgi:O-succinylbenzoic acid--CoA ligase